MSYCVHCNTELPEGARYCHSCGKEVYRVKARTLGRIAHREVVPYREERQDHDSEFVRITPSLVTAVPEAAALVLYGNASMQGETIQLSVDWVSSPEVRLKNSELFADISPRQAKGKTYYVALFPLIYFFTCDGKKADITHATGFLKSLPRLGLLVPTDRKTAVVTLYPGFVTEVDWSAYEGSTGAGAA